MANHIPREFIDEILARIDIIDIIDARVPLKKVGANYKACCPFHNEKTPSFTVHQGKQFYHCFGCGAHGTVVNFLMEYDRLSFPETIATLAKTLGMNMPNHETPWQSQQRQQRLDLYSLMSATVDLYRQSLAQSTTAMAYLTRRGLTKNTIQTYAIGYAPSGWDFILRNAGKTNADREKLNLTGMLISKDTGKQYDRFRDRIMFPIRDQRGKVLGFGGRVLEQGEPKYLNSPETPIFHKGRELYGLYEAKQAVKELRQILVVEGYMDVVMLAQHRIPYAVATLGTACTEHQLQRLFRHVEHIVFCFDGDDAGRTAAWRALTTVLPVLQDGHQVSFLFLPEGEDPDSLVLREGTDAFLQRVQQAMPLPTYFIEHLRGQVDVNRIDGLSHFIELAKPLLATIKATTFSLLLKKELARIANVAPEQLFVPSDSVKHEQNLRIAPVPVGRRLQMTVLRTMIAALITMPSLAHTVSEDSLNALSDLHETGVDFVIELITLLQKTELSTAALLDRYRDTRYEKNVLTLARYDFQLESDGVEQVFKDAIANLLHRAEKKRKKQLLLKPKHELTEAELDFLKKS